MQILGCVESASDFGGRCRRRQRRLRTLCRVLRRRRSCGAHGAREGSAWKSARFRKWSQTEKALRHAGPLDRLGGTGGSVPPIPRGPSSETRRRALRKGTVGPRRTNRGISPETAHLLHFGQSERPKTRGSVAIAVRSPFFPKTDNGIRETVVYWTAIPASFHVRKGTAPSFCGRFGRSSNSNLSAHVRPVPCHAH